MDELFGKLEVRRLEDIGSNIESDAGLSGEPVSRRGLGGARQGGSV